MAYTPSPLRSKVQTNNFSGQRTDGNRVAMEYANAFQTIDGTGTAVVSPVTVATTQTLTVPTNAIRFVVVPTTNAIQVSEDSTFSASFAVPAGQVVMIDCADQQFIYLKAASSTVVNFYFATV